ncbi:MAG: porphobilinogen synthase [SAR86 cluster bacterium]|jgi:porphobilinogen synthase|nr:porphobilinogen synthase [SAR86 cluster bacterium]MDG1230418.1 porphobilinogen synthase [SAR86 cluster bacterium]MDG1681136.1 porphobilinogen synthase [SAR86 cluster bacterium]|tara:strand:+ start:244 stop:1239 length:996 start_codon:yes stop_codon:yes gene_type:complete
MNASRKFPQSRLRRTRFTASIRNLIAENDLTVNDLIQPIFVKEGLDGFEAINSLPGINRYGLNALDLEIEKIQNNKINAVAIFPVIDPNKKDEQGTESLNEDNLVCEAIKQIKKNSDLAVIADVALDPYTSHGHDGLLDESGYVDNDRSLATLTDQAMTLAKAGADMVAPSDMMDGRIASIRDSLENNGFVNTIILSYAAKYSSKFYGPFRDAVGSSSNLGVGSKDTYQMSVANIDEALHEVRMDLEEGADIVMVKPGMPYLDVIKSVKETFKVPTFAYQVSGEYAMLKAAIQNEWLVEDVLIESLLSFKRAGADCVLTYAANEVAVKLNQ